MACMDGLAAVWAMIFVRHSNVALTLVPGWAVLTRFKRSKKKNAMTLSGIELAQLPRFFFAFLVRRARTFVANLSIGPL